MTREQLGITDAMLATFGETVFQMSHNLQTREGDPVRALDWAEIERQREAMGLADVQIAERLGLTREQVMFIRNSEESRRFRTGQTAYLLDLGGGRRYRPERVVRLEDRFSYSEDALRLRAAFKFDPELARRYVEQGWWRDDTLPGWLSSHSRTRPDAPALIAGQVMYLERARRTSPAFRRRPAARGRGARRRGGGAAAEHAGVRRRLPRHLPPRRGDDARCTCRTAARRSRRSCATAARSSASACRLRKICFGGIGRDVRRDRLRRTPLSKDVPGPVAADPFLLLYTSGTTAAPKGVPHNYHTMLSNARLGAPEHRLGASRPHRFGGAVHASLRLVRAALRVRLRGCVGLAARFHARLILSNDREAKSRRRCGPRRRTSPPCARRACSTSTTGRRSGSRSCRAAPARRSWCAISRRG